MNKKDISESEYYRQSVVMSESKKSFPLVILIIIFAVGVLVLYYTTLSGGGADKYGIGNPYNCAECKELGFACKEHRNVDLKKLLMEKVERYGYNFKPNGTEDESKQWMYGEYNYNKDCDFCNELKSECYSCEYDRKTIDAKMNNISDNEIFKTKLCNTDWVLGYANCSNCRAILITEVKETFK